MSKISYILFLCLLAEPFTDCTKDTISSLLSNSTAEQHTLTLVTALYNIHRETWPNFSRNQTKYHADMRNVLRLKIPMVIFTDAENHAFMEDTRNEFGLANLTRAVIVPFEELPMYAHRAQIERIQQRELNTTGGWDPEWETEMRLRPEVFSPDYDVLVNCKIHFLNTAMKEDYFGTKFLSWLDAGFSHLYPEKWARPGAFDWYPKFPAHKITMLKRTTKADLVTRYQLKDLYHRLIPEVLNAGLMAGDHASIAQFNTYFYEEVKALLQKDMIEDEQVFFVLVAAKHPELFNLVEKDCGPDLNAVGDQCVTQGDAFDLLHRVRRFVRTVLNFV